MRKTFTAIAFTLLSVLFPVAASAASVSITALTPGTAVTAKNALKFTLLPVGFSYPVYQLSDSFSGSTVSVNNIDPGGHFAWVPVLSDVGTHVLTITTNDSSGNTATITQTITVNPAPKVLIQNVSTNGNLPAGKALTFLVSQTGFTNPTYIVSDSFSGSSVSTSNLSSGLFSWVPDISQNGDHTITVYASDASGQSATATQFVRVGTGPTIGVQQLSPSTNVKLGQNVTFTVFASNFQPTSYSVQDSFQGGTLTNASINTNGQFSWMPSGSDTGTHTLTIKGVVGAFGDSATTSLTLNVLGADGLMPAPATLTQATSTTMLSALQAQLAALMAKMKGQTPAATTESTTDSTVQKFTLNLKPGSKGDEVLRLQNLLVSLGLLTNTPNGYYGVGTTAAIKKFQTEHGLEPLGSVGPGTRAALNAKISGQTVTTATVSTSGSACGFKFEHFMGYGDDDASQVSKLQECLISLGHLSGTATGFYGRATETAVKKFQSSKGLEPLGYVNTATRVVLNQ